MKAFIAMSLAGGLLATPALAQGSSAQGLLQGLLSGNQHQDQAVRDAFERGYQKGRQDEAHMHASNRTDSRSYDTENRYESGGDRDRRPNGGYTGNNSYSNNNGYSQGSGNYPQGTARTGNGYDR